MVVAAVKMFGFLGVILGCLVAASLYLKQRRGAAMGPGGVKSLMRVVQRCQVGVKKSIVAVEVPGAVLLVGVSADSMSLLARLEGDAMSLSPLQASGDGAVNLPFAAQLKRTVMGFRGGGETAADRPGRSS
jgi:flagellar biogenesis protein FliO